MLSEVQDVQLEDGKYIDYGLYILPAYTLAQNKEIAAPVYLNASSIYFQC